jgi:hypothetical protein
VTLALAARWSRRIVPVAAAIGLIGAIGFSQDIPDVLRPDLNVAYTDTDGNGQRGDRRPPGAEKYYRRSTPRSGKSPAGRATRPSCSPRTTASCPTTRTTASRG